MLDTGYTKMGETLISGFFLAENQTEQNFFFHFGSELHNLYKYAFVPVTLIKSVF